MGLCTDSCCNAEKRNEERARQEALDFMNRLEFARRQAASRGQTADRVGSADHIPATVFGSQVIESKRFAVRHEALTLAEQRALSCPCHCGCENLITVADTRRCRECRFGQHLRA